MVSGPAAGAGSDAGAGTSLAEFGAGAAGEAERQGQGEGQGQGHGGALRDLAESCATRQMVGCSHHRGISLCQAGPPRSTKRSAAEFMQ